MGLRVGVVIMPTDPWPDTLARVRRLERLGYDHVWVYDHVSWQRYRDRAWHAANPLLAGLAAGTESIGLGTLVSNPNIRHPLLLAKDAMTIDHISDGRLTLGVGAGGTGYDAVVLGQTPLTPAQRAERLAEMVDVLDRLLRLETTSHRGRWYTIDEGRVLPGCVQQPRVPLAVAAGGPRTIKLAAARADAWVTIGDATTAMSDGGEQRSSVEEQVATLDAACRSEGRRPSDIDRVFVLRNTDPAPLESLAAFAELTARLERLSFTDVVFHHPRPDDPLMHQSEDVVDQIAAARGERPR